MNRRTFLKLAGVATLSLAIGAKRHRTVVGTYSGYRKGYRG